MWDRRSLARVIDHTLLRPQATPDDVRGLCDEALAHGFHAVCVAPSYLPLCRQRLAGSEVGLVAVVGFPLGASASEVKAYEAERALAEGASELDVVLPIGRLIAGDLDYVRRDLAAVAARRRPETTLKVILETTLLDRQQVTAAVTAVRECGGDYVKTSTGFGPGGATEADVSLLRELAGTTLGVKAAGRIRDLATALRLLAAGANRLGTSAGLRILLAAGVAGTPAAGPP